MYLEYLNNLMGTSSTIFIHINGKSYTLYNHFDSYFEGLGAKLVSDYIEVLERENGLNRLKEVFTRMEEMEEDEDAEEVEMIIELNPSELMYRHNCNPVNAPYNNFDVVMETIERNMEEGKKLHHSEEYRAWYFLENTAWRYVFDLDENQFCVSSNTEEFCMNYVPLQIKNLKTLLNMYKKVMDIE